MWVILEMSGVLFFLYPLHYISFFYIFFVIYCPFHYLSIFYISIIFCYIIYYFSMMSLFIIYHFSYLGFWSVRFSSVFTKTVTEPKLSVSVLVLTEKNWFSFDQNHYRSVITKNWTDLPTHSSGIHHAKE
jgi:hypothetical protein